jgi:SpoVK/Ycf46/Vps4 family AAA+-type ATPase
MAATPSKFALPAVSEQPSGLLAPAAPYRPMGDNPFCEYMKLVKDLYARALACERTGRFYEEYNYLFAAHQLLEGFMKLCPVVDRGACAHGEGCLTGDSPQTATARGLMAYLQGKLHEKSQSLKREIDDAKRALAQKTSGADSPAADFACKSLLSFGPDSKECKNWFRNIIGAEAAKEQLKDGFVNALLYPNIFGKAARAALFYGLPGTGKTLLAKALMNELQNLSIPPNGGQPCQRFLFFAPTTDMLKGKYVGETEQKLVNLFSGASELACAAKAASRVSTTAIVFIDEVDSLVPTGRGAEGPQAQITASAVNTMLQLIGGVNEKDNVIFVAATNFPQSLDEAFMRRMTFQIPVPLPDEGDIVKMINFFISRHVKEVETYDTLKAKQDEVCARGREQQASDCDEKMGRNQGCAYSPENLVDVAEWKQHLVAGPLISALLDDAQIRNLANLAFRAHYSGADIEKMFQIGMKYSGAAALKHRKFIRQAGSDGPYYSVNCLPEFTDFMGYEVQVIGHRGRHSFTSVTVGNDTFGNVLDTDVLAPFCDMIDEVYVKLPVLHNNPTTFMLQFNVEIFISVDGTTVTQPLMIFCVLNPMNLVAKSLAAHPIFRFFTGAWTAQELQATTEQIFTSRSAQWWDTLRPAMVFACLKTQLNTALDDYTQIIIQAPAENRVIPQAVSSKAITRQFSNRVDEVASYLAGVSYNPTDTTPPFYYSINPSGAVHLRLPPTAAPAPAPAARPPPPPPPSMQPSSSSTPAIPPPPPGIEGQLATVAAPRADCEAFMRKNATLMGWDMSWLHFMRAMKDVKPSYTADGLKKFLEWKKV